jgi:transposase
LLIVSPVHGHHGRHQADNPLIPLSRFPEPPLVFRSKRGDRVKILVWDGSGLVLVYKRIDSGRFAWPGVADGVMRLSRAQFEALFEGLDWRRVTARRVRPPAAAD